VSGGPTQNSHRPWHPSARLKPTTGSQLALLATYGYRACITDRLGAASIPKRLKFLANVVRPKSYVDMYLGVSIVGAVKRGRQGWATC
jgi:hypothetical protein